MIVLGILGRTPLAGVSWQVLHYLEGFRRLGYDVYYVEDTGCTPYHPDYPVAEQRTPPPGRNQYAINSEYAVAYVAELMASLGFQNRWCYCSRSDGRAFGMTRSQLSAVPGLRQCADQPDRLDTIVRTAGRVPERSRSGLSGNRPRHPSGLVAFATFADILCAIDAIESDYPKRELACEYFAAEKVLGRLMDSLAR